MCQKMIGLLIIDFESKKNTLNIRVWNLRLVELQ